jgi:AAA domain
VPAIPDNGHRIRCDSTRFPFVIFVTGVSGTGKSTLARRLATWGHRTVSTDADGRLCSWTDTTGRRVHRAADPDSQWLSRHEWRWDPDRLDEIIAQAAREGDENLWLFGHAANAVEFVDRFHATILLEIDKQTMISRMSDPARGTTTAGSATPSPPRWTPTCRSWRRGAGRASTSSTPPETSTPSPRNCS